MSEFGLFSGVIGDASGVRPGGEDLRAANVPVGDGQPLVRGQPERTIGHCFSCNISLRRKRKHMLNQNERAFNFFQEESINRGSVQIRRNNSVCHSCWCRYLRYERQQTEIRHTECITLPNIQRSASTQSRCIFGCSGGRFRISETTRAQVLNDFRFYIPRGARVCPNHNEVRWVEIPQRTSHVFQAGQITDMMDLLSSLIETTRTTNINFDFFEDLDDETVHQFTGLSKLQFAQVLQETPTLTRLEKRHPETALAIYLCKLSKGYSNEEIANMFVNGHRSTAERLMSKAREALTKDFVPRHLGFQHTTREEMRDKCTNISRRLFLHDKHNSVITIWDGTYVYTCKSNNNAFQRKSYSLHKHRHLIKPMICVSPNGYIIDVLGPFPATKNDATIMQETFRHLPDVRAFFRRDDVFIVDRGFRDVIPDLTNLGYDVKLPELIPNGETQLSDISANRSRLVTKCRFVVETINGHLKTCYKYFNSVWQIQSVPHLMTDFKIAAACHNVFHSAIVSDNDNAEIAEYMLNRLHKPNDMARIVREFNLNRHQRIFATLGAEELEGFPVLTQNDLQRIALGSYQIRQARSYYGEHINEHGQYLLEVNVESHNNIRRYGVNIDDPLLIRGRMQSRHQNRTKYYVYILCEKNGISADSIKEYYCTCKNGCRTVGCCTYVMTFIWYLGYEQHQEDRTRPPADYISNIFVQLESSSESND